MSEARKNTIHLIRNILLLCMVTACGASRAEDGYRLWLRYDPVSNQRLLQHYRAVIRSVRIDTASPTLAAARQELLAGLEGLLGQNYSRSCANPLSAGTLLAGTPSTLPLTASYAALLTNIGDEGFIIRTLTTRQGHAIVIAANTDIGVLYGIFHFLRLLQTERRIDSLDISSRPFFHYRMLDHWDNLNRSVERGYAGISLWDWFTLPGYTGKRYVDYARANASVGINRVVLNNVNANALILSAPLLEKVAALAAVFRPYGIKVYLSARFSAPMEAGGLPTADPLDDRVRQWWMKKADEIYRSIPDFGGFLVKANSEGQPGPQNYGRTHADGANMLAGALAPHKGMVIWRAFVYSNGSPEDRAGQAYNEFQPLDGKFRENVWVQVKNGPIDFQPREPFHPLFGAMPHTRLMPEFQLTQEYLGFSTHLVYLAPLIKECLDADTYANGKGSTVAKVVSPGIAAVANTGNDINWCGHPFAQANWYAYGRLAWDPGLSSASIAEEWTRATFTNDPAAVDTIKKLMLGSREIAVQYMTPLGLHHIMGYNHHYGPAPWFDKASRPDWNPVYYHKADTVGIGFDRTTTGSRALTLYHPAAQAQWADAAACPDKWLLWFHHVPWDHRMSTGRDCWNELCCQYDAGAHAVLQMRYSWQKIRQHIDPERWQQVDMLLGIQAREAAWWRNACLSYFQTFSRRPLPPGLEQPDHTLAWYEALEFPYAPGIQSK